MEISGVLPRRALVCSRNALVLNGWRLDRLGVQRDHGFMGVSASFLQTDLRSIFSRRGSYPAWKKRNLLKISTNIKAHVRVTGAEPCTRFWEQFLNLDFENSDSLFSVHIRSKSFDFVWIKLKLVCTSISMTKYIVAWNVASFKLFQPWATFWWIFFFLYALGSTMPTLIIIALFGKKMKEKKTNSHDKRWLFCHCIDYSF